MPIIFILFISLTNKNALAGVLESLQQVYGKEYGVDWMFFPDDTGEPHYVSLKEDRIAQRSDLLQKFQIPGEFMEFRYYVKPSKYILLDEGANPKYANDIVDFYFKTNTQLKVITHGMLSSADSEAVTAIKDAYLNTSEYNVIAVDWNFFAKNLLNYAIAVDEAKLMGDTIGNFLKAISENYNVPGADMHLIGHSLGAHMMGNAALASQLRIGRITGLDPARPIFETNTTLDQRLDDSDAEFVDAIHTSSGLLGFEGPIGHADFYPNGGKPSQPGCSTISEIGGCSHGMSHRYFAESISNPDSFPAYQCDDEEQFEFGACPMTRCHNMGEHVDTRLAGKFFLQTNPYFPFGKAACV